jgi:hypothetical protein
MINNVFVSISLPFLSLIRAARLMYEPAAPGCFLFGVLPWTGERQADPATFYHTLAGAARLALYKAAVGLRENYFVEFEASFNTSFAHPTAFWTHTSASSCLPSTTSLASPRAFFRRLP